jgi:DNA polymerase-3 subunit epsilon
MEYAKEITKYIKNPIVIYDLETTSPNPETAEIVQFAAIKLTPKGKMEEISFLIKPDKPIPEQATAINHISNDDVKDEKSFSDYAKKIAKFFEGCDIAGFNISTYDNKLLSRYMEINGFKDFLSNRTSYDVYSVFKMHYSRKLSDAVKIYLGREIEDAHDALGDVKSTLEVMAKQLERESMPLEQIVKSYEKKAKDRELERLIGYNDKNEPILLITKDHKNKRLVDLDDSLVKWFQDKDFPQSFKDLLTSSRK